MKRFLKTIATMMLVLMMLVTQTSAFAQFDSNVNFQPIRPIEPIQPIEPESEPESELDSWWDHAHEWGEWEIMESPYGTAMGRHQRQCKICGVKMSERFYSDDTLYRGIEDREDDVRKMQEALIEQGYLKGKADGKFGMQTQQAVRNFQRDHGFYQDGTAWEPVLEELFGTEKVHLEITDVVPPFANCTGETTAFVVNEGYQVTGVAWLYNGAAMSADEIFTEGETYTVRVSLLADEPEGKEYTASVNGEGAAAAYEPDGAAISVTCAMVCSDGWGGGGMNGSVTLVTEIVNFPQVNPNFFVPGEEVRLQTRLTNTGDVALENVVCTSSLPGVALNHASYLKPGHGLVSEYSYTVTFDDVLAGITIPVQTEASWDYEDGGADTASAPEVLIPVNVHDGGLAITKTEVSKPANGYAYTSGETIKYSIDVQNQANQDLFHVVVKDLLTCAKGVVESNLREADVMKKDESWHLSYEYKVTPEDVALGLISNVANVSGKDRANLHFETESEATVSTGEPLHQVTVETAVANTPQVNPNFFVPGEVIQFETTITNLCNADLMDVQMNSTLPGMASGGTSQIKPGEAKTYIYSYTATFDDALAGRVVNESGANFRYADTMMMDSAAANKVTVPVSIHDGTLDITQVLTSSPANGSYYRENDAVRFSITATNNTNQEMFDVVVEDALTNASGSQTTTLSNAAKWGEASTMQLTYEYTLTAADLERGEITNNVTITAKDRAGLHYESQANPIRVSCADPLSKDPVTGELPLYGELTGKDDTTHVVGSVVTTPTPVPDESFITGEAKTDEDDEYYGALSTETPKPDFIFSGVVVATPEPAATPEPTAAPKPAAEADEEPADSHTDSGIHKPAQQPLWLTVTGTPVDGAVGRSEYSTSASLYKAQLSGDEETGMVLSAASDEVLGNQIIYIADLEDSGVFSAIGSLFNFEAAPSENTVFFGPKNTQATYQIAALMRMNVSDEPFNLTNMTDLTSRAVYKVYHTALSMAPVRLQNVEVSYGDDMLTMVVWDQAHQGQCLVVVAKKQ